MASESDSVVNTHGQLGGENSLVSSAGFASSRSTTAGLVANQAFLEPNSKHLDNTEANIAGDSSTSGLHQRHGRGAGDGGSGQDTLVASESFGTGKFHNMRVTFDNDNADVEVTSLDTVFTESTVVPRRNLGFIQITSLMLNATIGSGPFVTPGYVLALTRSKPIALVLWAFGGVYTALTMLVYIEFGSALPYNGGTMIYLDEMFHRPRLLVTVIFSVFWIIKAGTYSSSKNVAQYTLALASPDTPMSEIPDGLVRFTAIVVQTVVCLLLYFARRLCFVFNSGFALYKIILLLFIFIAGMANIQKPNSGLDDFNEKHAGYTSANSLNAMLAVIYSYEGWDGANYIAGEIEDYKTTLRWAAITTAVLLTVLQMLATFAFYAVFDFDTLTGDEGQDNIALVFAQKAFGTVRGMEVAVGLSIFAQLVFVTYTTAKVKQAIAWQRIIPFYKFFGRQDPQFDSPGGGLVLHWIFTVLTLIIFKSKSDARSFYSGIYQYGYAVIGLFLGVGLLKLKSRMRLLDRRWKPAYLKTRTSRIILSFLVVGMNMIILVMTALPSGNDIPNFYWPITILGFIGFGIIYWGALRVLEATGVRGEAKDSLGARIGLEIGIYEAGDEIPEDMRFLMSEAILDGSRRRLDYKVSGPLLRLRNGCRTVKDFVFRNFGY